MTDHEKLLVAMLSEADDDVDDEVPTAAVMTLLYELGNTHRRTPDPRTRSATASPRRRPRRATPSLK